jgi:hypothetical protein
VKVAGVPNKSIWWAARRPLRLLLRTFPRLVCLQPLSKGDETHRTSEKFHTLN